MTENKIGKLTAKDLCFFCDHNAGECGIRKAPEDLGNINGNNKLPYKIKEQHLELQQLFKDNLPSSAKPTRRLSATGELIILCHPATTAMGKKAAIAEKQITRCETARTSLLIKNSYEF